MRSLGFKTLLKDEVQSPVITSFLYPDKEFDFKEFYHQLKEKGFVIYPGKISQADKKYFEFLSIIQHITNIIKLLVYIMVYFLLRLPIGLPQTKV